MCWCYSSQFLSPGLGIVSFAHCSFAHCSFAHLLKSLRTNEWMWAICSGRSEQMSDYEWIAQVAHDKLANLSDLLRSLRTNEQTSKLLRFLSKLLIFLFSLHKISNSIKNSKNHMFCTILQFFEVEKKKKICSFFLSSEQIAQVAQDKCATVSDSLTSLRRNEWLWANRSGRSPKMSERAYCSLFEQMAHMLTF